MCVGDVAWLAGFFDGEGSLCRYHSGSRGFKSWVLLISNTCRKSLLHCMKITGCGSVNPKPVKPGRKQQWQWAVPLLSGEICVKVA